MKTVPAFLLALAVAASATTTTLPLDADAAAKLALAASGRVVSSNARLDAAGERVGAADARRLPSVDVEAALARHSSVPEAVLPGQTSGQDGFVLFPDIRDAYRAGVVLTQPVWTGGSISGARAAARHDETAAEAEVARIEIDLQFQARSTYWAAVAAEAALVAVRAEVARAERLLADARALRAAGMAVRADELGAEARLAGARRRAIAAEADVADRLAELRSLLGIPHGTDVELADQGTNLPGTPPGVDELVADAKASRPEIAALAARRDATRFRARVATASQRPQLALSGRWDVARPNDRYLPPEDEWNTSWSVGVVAGWRVFDGNRSRAEAAALDAEGLALVAEIGELERVIAVEVENARRAVLTALAAADAAATAVAAAAAREADSRERYTEGITTVVEVLDAQAELAQAELALARTRVGIWAADAGLRRAVGR